MTRKGEGQHASTCKFLDWTEGLETSSSTLEPQGILSASEFLVLPSHLCLCILHSLSAL